MSIISHALLYELTDFTLTTLRERYNYADEEHEESFCR